MARAVERGEVGTIRPYEASDRAAVRRICFDTGFMGDPVAWQWRDAESFADLFSGWYTDRSPETAYVAELDGRVVGYLLGCIDSRMVGSPAKVMRHHLFSRGLLVRPGTAGVLWRSIGDAAVGALRRDLPPVAVIDERWPAHLHIDFLPEGRGLGLGLRIVRTWFDRLRAEGVPGCHLETMAENANAIAFFEAVGFRREGRNHPIPGLRQRDGSRLHTQLMVLPGL